MIMNVNLKRNISILLYTSQDANVDFLHLKTWACSQICATKQLKNEDNYLNQPPLKGLNYSSLNYSNNLNFLDMAIHEMAMGCGHLTYDNRPTHAEFLEKKEYRCLIRNLYVKNTMYIWIHKVLDTYNTHICTLVHT